MGREPKHPPIPLMTVVKTSRGSELSVNYAAPDFVAAVETAEPQLAPTKTRADRDAVLDAFQEDLLARWLVRLGEKKANALLLRAAALARRMISTATDEAAPL